MTLLESQTSLGWGSTFGFWSIQKRNSAARVHFARFDDAQYFSTSQCFQLVSSRLTQRPASQVDLSVGYIQARADLGDIASGDYLEGEQPSSAAISAAGEVLNRTEGWSEAPEITPLENGVIHLFWCGDEGFASLELGRDSFGLSVRNQGRSVVRRNGSVSELWNELGAIVAIQHRREGAVVANSSTSVHRTVQTVSHDLNAWRPVVSSYELAAS